MTDKDWDKLAAIERAIKEKYGEDSIKNPISEWSKEKEEKYRQQLEERAKILQEKQKKDQSIEKNGFLIKKKLVNKATSRLCPVKSCEKYSFSIKDDVYMNKFGCCYQCYVQYVEGREHMWESRRKELTDGSI